jgi:hypothetical protein
MASVTLVHSEETLTVSALELIKNCSLFENNPALLVSPYQLNSLETSAVSRVSLLTAAHSGTTGGAAA